LISVDIDLDVFFLYSRQFSDHFIFAVLLGYIDLHAAHRSGRFKPTGPTTKPLKISSTRSPNGRNA